MWYAIAAIVVVVVGGVIWAVVRSGRSGEARAERDFLTDAGIERRNASKDYDKELDRLHSRWLARRKRQRELRDREGRGDPPA